MSGLLELVGFEVAKGRPLLERFLCGGMFNPCSLRLMVCSSLL